uniref:Uncharacterized protein n=1 Tax=Nelumbo nucifera TaxID=4432 RepID=A0A822YNL2_NELNU|nr:TPA_asm: hypothetical protein HUJ06_004820 [Nelumbo nucifera]
MKPNKGYTELQAENSRLLATSLLLIQSLITVPLLPPSLVVYSVAASSMATLKQPTNRVVAIIAEYVPESDIKQLIAYARANNKISVEIMIDLSESADICVNCLHLLQWI